MDKLFIIKIGGNVIDNEEKLSSFIKEFAALKEKKILIHGGGKLATKLAEELKIPQSMIEGRRVTDHETLKIVTMVYAGYINKSIVAQLQASNCDAIGLTGADGNTIMAHKRQVKQIGATKIDYGFVGDVDEVNGILINRLINNGLTPVIAPITHNGKGQLLNTNADTISQEIAKALAGYFETTLIYCFEKKGVLIDQTNEDSIIPKITATSYKELKEKNIVFAGMLPKLDNAFTALLAGVHKVIIGKAEDLNQIISGEQGTSIVKG